eukprot:gnl/TRDRNA2_/TRDRNA2_50550_c0_seq1.p1 gnl/TRDRNA2_/TRDRNA2_50550_c0~~gnl/TRDRNA2_/TRDRNA2_50550_c0_seq1.p1  ORF type:complete len:131 (+),score=21.81 gnl/TRDRNA2_/TRDRNA2_50550_c0_seq1:206-598(+)
MLARQSEQHLKDFSAQNRCMALLALTRLPSLEDAWRFFDRLNLSVHWFSPVCLGVALMECEQRRLLEHEVQVLHDLDKRLCDYFTQIGFVAAARHVTLMRLAGSVQAMLLSQGANGGTFSCIWCGCRDHS